MTRSLPSAAEKPRYVAAMFGRIARRYDLMNTLMTAGQDARWRRVVAHSVADAADVLDVGTGTGKLARAVAHLNPRACVVGVDLTFQMLRVASSTRCRAQADALSLPFPDASFDAVVSAFVLRNLADVPAGLAEQARVLRPGGRLVVLETTPGPRGVLRLLYRLYFTRLVPLLGRLVAGDASAYSYLPQSSFVFATPERLAHEVHLAGFTNVTVTRLSFGSVAVTAGILRRAGGRQ